jgi:glycosyltransferase involved in cell wall biosynthesis
MKIVACTPTTSRGWAWAFSQHCMDTQILKPDLWVIVDNGTEWACAKDRPDVLYDQVDERKPIGWLRNRCLELALEAGADYIVFWDDDDYYPPARISSSIAALEATPTADIAGSSLMYLLLTRENVLMTTGPFNDHHATAATMVIRRRYAETHRFDPAKLRGEELQFTDSWNASVVQLHPEDVIVVMGHARNTVDKSVLLKTPETFRATILNTANGRMVVRMKWPRFPWDLFRSTFSV